MSHRAPDRKPRRQPSRKIRLGTGVAGVLLGGALVVAAFAFTIPWLIIPGAVLIIFGLLTQRR